MNQKLNLKPLQELLTTGITPEELSYTIDELLFDYFRLIVNHELECEVNDEGPDIHLETNSFVFNLKELRDTLRQCVASNN